MIQSQQVLPVNASLGSEKSQPDQKPLSKEPSTAPATFLAIIIVILALGGGLLLCLHSAQLRIVASSPFVDSKTGIALHSMHPALVAVAISILIAGTGVALFRLTRKQARSWRSRLELQREQDRRAWEESTVELHEQLEQKTRQQEQLLKQQEELRAEIATLTHSGSTQAEELNRLRQMQKSMAGERSELARTKSVLELHVQARTQELEKLQRRYELILNSAGEGICGLNSEGNISFANPTAAEIMGYEVDAMIGQPAGTLFPNDPAAVDAEASGSSEVRPKEIVWKRADGSRFVAEYFRSPIHEGQRFVGEVVLFKDITERREAAETLAQKAEELARSNTELEQFAFVASHDLQEPLRKIQAFGDRLKTKCDQANLRDGREYLERMQNASARMQTLINDLLTFSRVLSRTQPFVSVDLNASTREVLGDLEFRIEKTGASVEVGELMTIDADPMQIRQLLQNLLSNALKFCPPETKPVVRVQGRVIDQPGELDQVRGRRADPGKADDESNAFFELTIQDNGIGFDEKYLDKIFAVFQRLHGRQEYEGTGIGLAVCRRIVDRHRGTLTAHSKPNEGATFVVTLPVHQSHATNA